MSVLYPNVPLLPGVPPVLRSPTSASSLLPQILLTADTILNALFQGQWGVYDQYGSPLIIGDSVMGFDYRNETKNSTYPIEDGGFQSYNKVQVPYDAKITFAIDGDVVERSTFLQDCDALARSTQLVNVVTPEMTYVNANATRCEYSRTRDNGGVSMIQVTMFFEEVRQGVTATFTNTTNPSDQDAAANGTVQPTDQNPPPTPATPPSQFQIQTGTGLNTNAASTDGGQYASLQSGNNSNDNGQDGTANGQAGGTYSGSDPNPPNTETPPTGVAPETTTTVTGLSADDPLLARTDLQGSTATLQKDGTYSLTYVNSSAPIGQSNQTITASSPNAGVAS